MLLGAVHPRVDDDGDVPNPANPTKLNHKIICAYAVHFFGGRPNRYILKNADRALIISPVQFMI
jgi:hypothetical protein